MTYYFNYELPTSTSLKEPGATQLANQNLTAKYGENAEIVMKAVCECFNIDREDLTGKSKQQPLAWRRAIAMAITYEMDKELSLEKVGEIYGGRNHATVIHSVKLVKASMDLFAAKRKDVNKVLRKIKELKS